MGLLYFQWSGLSFCIMLYQKRINDAIALYYLKKLFLYAKNL